MLCVERGLGASLQECWLPLRKRPILPGMLSLVIKALPGGSRPAPTWIFPLQEETGVVAGVDSVWECQEQSTHRGELVHKWQ